MVVGALLVTALIGAGCAAAIDEVAARTAGPVGDAVAGDGTFEAFVVAEGLAGRPRAEVLLGGTTGTDVALRVTAVVADTPATRARGLMGVTALPDAVGMLFAFPDAAGAERPGFWMRDTLVPLDIAFAADGVVVGVATMWPCTAEPCPITHPGVAYDVALEVAAGALDAAGVTSGDRFVWRITGGAGAEDAAR